MVSSNSSSRTSNIPNSKPITYSYSDEIARLAHDEIRVNTDEICFADEIKSVHTRQSRISSGTDFIHRRWIYPVRMDGFSWKNHFLRSGFFMELLARFELATSSLPRMRSTGWAIAAYGVKWECGAASQIWTGDLILTKDALYRLSYSSVSQTTLILYHVI